MPRNVVHTIQFDVRLKKPTTKDAVLKSWQAYPYAAVTHKQVANLVYSFGRDHGAWGRLLEEAILVAPTLWVSKDGKEVAVEMGSYGIGPTRVIPAIIEASHDDAGIVWPVSVAPFEAMVISIKAGDAASDAASEKFHAELEAAGIDPVYFGVVFMINNAIGLITPPVGTVLNTVAGVGKVPMDEVTRGVMPFMLAQFAVMFLMIAFPEIVMVPARWFY